MAAKRLGVLVLLLVYGVLVLGMKAEYATAKICPQICKGGATYMTRVSTGNQKLSPACNCCLAGAGCTIFYDDGTSDTCS